MYKVSHESLNVFQVLVPPPPAHPAPTLSGLMLFFALIYTSLGENL